MPKSFLAAGLLVAALTACGSQVAAQQTPPSTPPGIQAAFNPTDAAWLELMIPMDEQFLQILALAPTHSANPAVRRLAASLTAAHQAELTQLKAIRTEAGLPTTNPHEGHDMPGMMTADDLLALSNLHGAAFDRTFETEAKDHLAQSALVTRSVLAAGQAPAVKHVAAQIQQARTEQTTSLTTLRQG
ncbi:DUF305 domain-containing protein [Kribbella sp. NPDC026611]|uniref:DUF305 domain-containing protein n=1 Tax=Kribbella sp. NPDC026611 TaxID=3154911 RepID=UPI003400AE05